MRPVPPTGIGTAAALAGWVAELEFGAIPEPAVRQAKSCLIDSVACVLGGLALEPMRILLDVLSTESPVGPAFVPGTGRGLSITAAAHFGSQAANALDFDDTFRAGAPSHPGATVVPPALAVAASRGGSGRELLTAIIAGFEVSLRIGRAVRPSPERNREVMGFAPWQSFGATTAAAKLMGLPPDRIVSAFGLTGAQAPVPAGRKFVEAARPYPWIKNAYGAASEAGVRSALLAERGFRGDSEIFDGPHGFWIICGSDRYRPELATEALGRLWLIGEIGFKPYACCRWTHTMIDALREVKNELGLNAIERVEVRGFRDLACSLDAPAPASIIDAQFNARYVAALELAGHSPERGLHEAQLSDPNVLHLADRVRLIHDLTLDEPFYHRGELPAHVEVWTCDGRVLKASATQPRGSREAGGFGEAEIDAKFLQLASSALGDGKARAALHVMRNMEQHSSEQLSASLAL